MLKLTIGLLVLAAAALPAEAQSRSLKGKAEEWNQWRGPNRDGITAETGLLKKWPSGGPKLLWKVKGIGTGYSSVTVTGDLVIIPGELKNRSGMTALNAADGKKVWSVQVGEGGGEIPRQSWDGPRATPATDGKLIYQLGQAGEIAAHDVKTGRQVWRKHIQSEWGGRRPKWWWSESPLLDGDLVVVSPVSDRAGVVAFNKADGSVAWKSAKLAGAAHYTSIAIGMLGDKKQYIVLTDQEVAGLDASNGKFLWRARRKGSVAVIPTPVFHKDGFVFVTSGYKVGHNGFQLSQSGGRTQVKQIYEGKEMTNHHGGVILVGDHVYGLSDRGGLKCINVKTGKEVWANRSVGKGSTAYADGHLIVRSEKTPGPVALVEATPDGYKEKGRFTPPDPSGDRTWAHPVVANGRLYLRDHDVLLCYDVKAK